MFEAVIYNECVFSLSFIYLICLLFNQWNIFHSQAQRICLQRGDITRAVAMEAWRPFHSSYLSEDIANPDNHVVEGNASRVLSKSVAWWSAENVMFDSA